MAFPLRTICTLAFSLFCFSASAALPELGQPGWVQLTQQQRQILAPLAAEWDDMEAYRRKQWLGIADRYPSLPPAEQQRVQQRMRDWARLAPEERRQAREKYKTLKNVDPEQRESLRQNWEDYKALPEAERRRLQNEAVRRPPVSTMPPASAPAKLHRHDAKP
jgi:hypothetical protein